MTKPEHTSRREDARSEAPMPLKGKYQIIYADPPWSYDREYIHNKSRDAICKYNTMSTKEICNLPISDITSENCILFLWTTFPKLIESFETIKSWGFEYKTCGFVWIKKTKTNKNFFGMGRWTRSNAELCLIATKGKPKRINASISQIIESPIRKHSQKPDEVRNKIIQLVGDVPRIELFARQKTEGWSIWGKEAFEDVFPKEKNGSESVDSQDVMKDE